MIIKKIASVTGSRRGIGFAIIQELANEGYTVILSDVISAGEAAPLIGELKGRASMPITFHVTSVMMKTAKTL
jgi:NAD(P)-dependent dehydrogenase (short-subunit alcohol dehydrogenase family)